MTKFDKWYDKLSERSIVPVMVVLYVLLFAELSLLYILFYLFIF